jgi:hypothetical protein
MLERQKRAVCTTRRSPISELIGFALRQSPPASPQKAAHVLLHRAGEDGSFADSAHGGSDMALPTQLADGTASQCPQCHSPLKIFSIRGNPARIALCVSCMKGFSVRESSSTAPEKPGSGIQ